MKVKFVAEKIASSLVSLYSFFIMIVALMHVMVMDVIWPFAVAAAVVCPVWFWYVDKRWLSEKRIISWIIRLGALVIGVLIFTLGRDRCPFYRYMESMAQASMKTYFEDNLQSGTMQLKEVKDITKQEEEEYYLVTASLVYTGEPDGNITGAAVQALQSATGAATAVVTTGSATDAALDGGQSVRVTLYFDRWSGQYFKSMGDMQQYWVNRLQDEG